MNLRKWISVVYSHPDIHNLVAIFFNQTLED
jgi:hypothetical protein